MDIMKFKLGMYVYVQWNLSTTDKSGIGPLSLVERLIVPFSEVIIVSLLYHKINYYIGVNTVPGKAIEIWGAICIKTLKKRLFMLYLCIY